ncbi:hypothetical protein CUJ83_01840 [Methanocella sp. CWC-04]|uniref:Uncharacterized protein n=1 Tax=Methanooceanicella nereidis TaxID=2052831 RepID=A0AAP2RBA0_9EURY|nr:hypothetical protein [Methanocella sp. CWC-04]MCD1293736.1 hypothetical protein [Methanocella sp. CWC-04]
MDLIDELGQEELTVRKFLDELRDIKGYTSIISSLSDEYLEEHNRTLFYDGDILEYQVGTNRIVKVIVDGDLLQVLKDGVEYKGEKARALFKNDKEFKKWKKTCDGEENALLNDACARIEIYHVNYVYALKELILPKEYKFCTVQELMSFILSRDFESVQARYLPMKE